MKTERPRAAVISRRELLRGAAVAAVSAAATPALAGDALATRPPLYSRETFRPLVGAEFTGRDAASGADVRLTLVAVEDTPAPGQAPGAGPFHLRFRAAGAAPRHQATYALRHAAIGDFPLFLVPGLTGTRSTLTAVVAT